MPAPRKAASDAKESKESKRRAARPRERLDVGERRAQLLALGLAAFSERSYDEVSVDDLARAAGISKGLLYHYFPTKHDYYVAALEHAAVRLLAGTLASPELPAGEQLHGGLETYLDFVAQHGSAYVALMRGGIGFDPEVAAILERTRAAFVERIVRQVPGERVTPLLQVTLRGWVGFVEATSIEWLARRDVRRAKLVELLVGVLLEAVRLATGRPAAA